jgi:alkanesulfonate monooxygenase SsuD/methylene tetrahydromethanopterin reductase-like flavin-dependent oxidoreductase (luciferase family)
VLAPVINRDPEELRERLLIGPAELCAERIAAYAAAGAQRMFIWPVADPILQLERFHQAVRPLAIAG